jgi:hypothetical protein
MSELTDAIRQRGYWYIDVRPVEYVGNRVPYSALGSILDRTIVRLRGWDFPHIDRQGRDQRGNTWIGGETDWNWFKEAWRFYQSGHFVYQIGIQEDWAGATFPPNRLPLGVPALGVGDALFRISETYEFASRVAVTEAGADQMRIAIEVRRAAGRSLYIDDINRMPMDRTRPFSEPTVYSSVTVRRDDLAGSSRGLAIGAAIDLFARFGFHPTRALLEEQQAQLRWSK